MAKSNGVLSYRPEVDGMRALAVLPVLFFHAGFKPFAGGYVGVDIFFVISGFLITSIILQDHEKGGFSVVRFYERRARRILPALFLVLAACLPAAWIILFPKPLMDFGKSLAAVSVFASNMLFWRNTNYFLETADRNPLLHTWSLAVEEQFYLFYPLLILLVRRFAARWIVPILGLGFLTSLAGAILVGPKNQSMAFYFAGARAWELMLGALMVFRPLPKLGSLGRNGLSLAGLLMMVIPPLGFDQAVPAHVPSLLIPTLGAALVLGFGTGDTWAGKILSWKPFVGIGLISYSLYLWHQPLYAFAKAASVRNPTGPQFGVLILLSLLLAYLSWRFVEKPCRDRSRIPRRTIFTGALVLSLFFGGVGTALWAVQGAPSRFQKSVLETLKAADDNPFDDLMDAKEKGSLGRLRHLGRKDVAPSVFLWGDSHAGSIALALGRTLDQRGMAGIVRSFSSCPPIIGFYREEKEDCLSCLKYSSETLDLILGDPNVHTVILCCRWAFNVEGVRVNDGEGAVEGGRKAWPMVVGGASSNQDLRDKIRAAMDLTIQKLLEGGKNVILVYPVPEMGYSVPDADAKSLLKGLPPVSQACDYYHERNKFVFSVFDSLPPNPHLKRVYPEKLFCGGSDPCRCRTFQDGHVLYMDTHHLDRYGSELLVAEISKLF